MVMQLREKKKGARWRDHPGKSNLDKPTSAYQWRLLNKDRSKVLWPVGKEYSNYDDVLSNLRRIEFFKRNRGAQVDSSSMDLYSYYKSQYDKGYSSNPIDDDYIPREYPDGKLIDEDMRNKIRKERDRIRENRGSLKTVYKNYRTGCKKKGGQRYKVRR